jgi:hypothetical protein
VPPDPAAIDEVLEAPLPEACPKCGGSDPCRDSCWSSPGWPAA